jgi:hypothetical protein
MTVVVAGAGIAGLACARALAAAGVAVRVRERGRVVGGRLASKRFDGRPADIGAAYFTVSDERFAGVAAGWRSAGLARPWTEHLRVYGPTGVSGTTAAVTRWAAPGGLRTLAEALADGLDVTLGDEVASVGPGPVVDGSPADAVVLAMPGPQARRLLDPALTELAAAADAQSWQPVLATVLRYPERTWDGFAGAFVNDHPVLATVCDDGDRRGDGAPVLVAHSTAAFARPHLADPSAAGPALEAATRELLGLPAPATAVHVHRWTYAQPAAGTGDYLLHDGIALAGDAFGAPKVQTAWLSGHLLGLDLARRLTRTST